MRTYMIAMLGCQCLVRCIPLRCDLLAIMLLPDGGTSKLEFRLITLARGSIWRCVANV